MKKGGEVRRQEWCCGGVEEGRSRAVCGGEEGRQRAEGLEGE